MQLGAQFYTLREQCATLEDFAESLKRVAEIGYKTVQISGVCQYEAEWLDEQLKKNGLKCVVTHYDYKRIVGEPLETLKAHKRFGCDMIGIGAMPTWIDGLQKIDEFIAEISKPAKLFAENGAKLMYHNHAFEFEKNAEGKTYLEVMADSFTNEQLGFTLDSYWVQYAGGDPCEWAKKLTGRIDCVHLKDMAIVKNNQKMAVVGEGNMNFTRFIEVCGDCGTKFLLVEQDDCNGENPFDCLKRSYDYLHSIGLE